MIILENIEVINMNMMNGWYEGMIPKILDSMVDKNQSIEERVNSVAVRKNQIGKWVNLAVDVLDEEVISSYKEVLTDYVHHGPDNGELMDLAMQVLNDLKYADVATATETLAKTPDEVKKYFIQNIAFLYSNHGPDFVTQTLGRPLTAEEIVSFDLKRNEVYRREQKFTQS